MLNAYRRYGFGNSATPFLRPCGFSRSAWMGHSQVSNPLLSPGFAFLSELFERTLAGPPKRARLLSWALTPYSTSGSEGPSAAGFACPLRIRLQGLVTLLTVFSLRGPAGFLSRRRRSWDSPCEAFSTCKVTARLRDVEPTCRLPADRHSRRSGDREPQCRGFWALTLAGVPCASAKD